MKRETVKKAFVATVPVMTGYLVLGLGFGIYLRSKGMGAWWAFGMSTIIYAGSMQYLAAELIASGASLVAAALTTLMVNARHLFYGISMVDRYKKTGKAKPYLIYALTDETYSLVCTEPDMPEEEKNPYYLMVSVLNQFYWVGGTVLGSLVGGLIKFNTEGIDFALTALFLTVFTEQWLTSKDKKPAIIGLSVSLICLLIFGADDFLIPAMLGISAILAYMGRRERK